MMLLGMIIINFSTLKVRIFMGIEQHNDISNESRDLAN